MARPGRMGSGRPPRAEGRIRLGIPRDRFAVLLAIVTAACLGLAFLVSSGPQFLMPGQLASAHGAIENCGSCHTKSSNGKFAWINGLTAGDPFADSEACLTCHKMPDTAFNPHGASPAVLKQSTERLIKVAAETSTPVAARVQSIVFPTEGMASSGLPCATCHQEHKGPNFDLKKISNEQCRSCHVVKFDSFDGNHPGFDTYPFKRRTRIIYDHAGHFSKHFAEAGQKDAKRVPATCTTCHSSREDKRVMAVLPFEQTCMACHNDQVTGKERATGPKGIAFLSLPALDLDTLKEKNANIGEWPDITEAEVTPFMKVLLAQDDAGRAMIRRIEKLDLRDLSKASDADIAAVTRFVWRIKRLFYSLVTKKAATVLAELDLGGNIKVGKELIVNLTAGIPREVIVGAQREWLPNLGKEMANRKDDAPPRKGAAKPAGPRANFTESKLAASVTPEELNVASPVSPAKEAAIRLAQAARSPDQTDDLLYPNGGAPVPSGAPAAAAKPAADDDAPAAKPAATAPKAAAPKAAAAEPAAREPEVRVAQAARGADQTDDLLYPNGGAPAPSGPPGGAPAKPAGGGAPAAAPADDAAEPAAEAADTPKAAPAAPAAAIETDIDDENWADFGGWYRQDFAIFYRPGGHKDKFIFAWASLTGVQSPKGLASPSASVFDALTSKDAQGSCSKCHSVDDVPGKGRKMNFSPNSAKAKVGGFTNFAHEPHLGIMENRGCLTCHSLEKGRPYLKSYEHNNPQKFTANFGAVKKELCETCHTSSMTRQDCMLCHKYHVNGVATPIMNTKIPAVQ